MLKEFRRASAILLTSSVLLCSSVDAKTQKEEFQDMHEAVAETITKKLAKNKQYGITRAEDKFLFNYNGKTFFITDMQFLRARDNQYVFNPQAVSSKEYVFIITGNGTKLFVFNVLKNEASIINLKPVLNSIDMPFLVQPIMAATDAGLYFTVDGARSIFFANPSTTDNLIKEIVLTHMLNNPSKAMFGTRFMVFNREEDIMFVNSSNLRCPFVLYKNETICLQDIFKK